IAHALMLERILHVIGLVHEFSKFPTTLPVERFYFLWQTPGISLFLEKTGIMLKVGVLGAGHLGKIHLRLLDRSEKYELVGFHDPDEINAKQVAMEFGYVPFENLDKLIDQVDVVDIVTPTLSHYVCAKKAITKGKHVFLEKPITNTLDEALELIELAKKYKVKGQVGHVERFNPAFMAVRDKIQDPMFIEAHRLAEFNPRGTDVPVVLDLMIHDIDVI